MSVRPEAFSTSGVTRKPHCGPSALRTSYSTGPRHGGQCRRPSQWSSIVPLIQLDQSGHGNQYFKLYFSRLILCEVKLARMSVRRVAILTPGVPSQLQVIWVPGGTQTTVQVNQVQIHILTH